MAGSFFHPAHASWAKLFALKRDETTWSTIGSKKWSFLEVIIIILSTEPTKQGNGIVVAENHV